MRKVVLFFLIFCCVFLNAQTAVTDWGFIDYKMHGWSINVVNSGNVSIFGNNPNTGMMAIRGEFETMTPPVDSALVIRGVLEINGSGFDMPGYDSGLNFGVFYSDSAGTLLHPQTDSAHWSGTGYYHSGYLFLPPSGDKDSLGFYSGSWGDWTMGSIKNSFWWYTEGFYFRGIDELYRWPAWAVATAGNYQFEIIIAPNEDSSYDVVYNLWNDFNCYNFPGPYHYAEVESYQVPTEKFNSICFGLASWEESTTTLLKLHDVNVSIEKYYGVGIPIFECGYIIDWGIIGDRYGGWKISRGTISGEGPLTSWAAIRGSFCRGYRPVSVTGDIEFFNGGFDAENSLRFGIFDSDEAACIIETPDDSAHWYGTEDHHTGYLFVPPSGENTMLDWGDGQKGSVGAVVDDVWLMTENTNSYALTTNRQYPAMAIGGEGKYNFGISVRPLGDGTREIRYKLVKADSSYIFSGKVIDTLKSNALSHFNCVAFALDSGNTTTMLKVTDFVLGIDTIDIVVSIENADQKSLKTFELRQNHPNPFNSVTTINYQLPKSSNVKISIFNILGQKVKSLVNKKQITGKYKVEWDASGFTSGVYFYRLEAGDFTNIKKLVLLK